MSVRSVSGVLGLTLLLSACGSGTDKPQEVDASPVTVETSVTRSTFSGAMTDADRAAVLATLKLSADAKGQVLNECGEPITPQLVPVDVGSGVGSAVLVVMSGGPRQASCYGDGPGLTLLRRAGGGWKEIYSSRGGFLAIMKDTHNDAQDLVFAGPGLSHPLFTWNGTTYVRADREVPDDRLEGTTILP